MCEHLKVELSKSVFKIETLGNDNNKLTEKLNLHNITNV